MQIVVSSFFVFTPVVGNEHGRVRCVASKVDEHVRLAYFDEIRAQATDDAFDRIRGDSGHEEGARVVQESVVETTSAPENRQFNDGENDHRNDDERDECGPSGKSRFSQRVTNFLIVAEESSTRGGDPTGEFEDGVDTDTDDQADATEDGLYQQAWVLHIAKVGYFFSPSLPYMEWLTLGPQLFFFYSKMFSDFFKNSF